MVFKGIKSKWGGPLAALAFFSFTAQGGTLTGEIASPDQEPQPQQQSVDDDSPGFFRNHTWSGSFDRAGDATRAAELELKVTNIECDEERFKADNAAPELVQQRMNDCLQAQRNAQTYAKDAEGIRKMQRTFANVSRASDIAAVGAIGAVGYAQLIKKDESQAATMEGVAKIQETAGYVSYATGAADISMGAYALAAQKSKLEKMNKALSKVSKSGFKLSQSDSALVSKLKNAAEQTKKAAYSHMAYGAGKVAVGYASMYLADKNRQIAASLGSIDPNMMAAPGISPPTAPYVYQGANGSAYYQNNNPELIMPTGSSTAAGPADTESFSGAGAGASVMPSQEFRQPASSSGKGGGLGGLGSAMSSGGGAAPSPEAAAEATATEEGKTGAPAAEVGLNIGAGGGGSRYGGGGTPASEESAPSPGVVGGADAKSSGTGVNPNSIYRDAMEGLDDQAQGSMAGVSGSGQTLFQVIKVKYNKMMEVGRLQGPGAVEVRN
jgi:hypothetical protein